MSDAGNRTLETDLADTARECDCYLTELLAARETIARCDTYERQLTAAVARLTAERDAARAVVEDVDAALDHGIDDAEDGLWPCGASRGEAIRRLRAEVTRLRAAPDCYAAAADTMAAMAEAEKGRGE